MAQFALLVIIPLQSEAASPSHETGTKRDEEMNSKILLDQSISLKGFEFTFLGNRN
jgi:hypothetical protein